ncbi:methyltransferase domain-containing protein [Streptomyces sp. MMS24-I29]|uniref:methyltransferase domain-containing protein n=1 Tax=Streptomyces sp. MMS24-I29 TaxID=3351480 RepID=UPI003C7B6FCE
MLADTTRLTAFHNAMAEVIANSDCVLDAGTGTGILAAMASHLTAGRVVGVEYLKDTASFAKQALQASHPGRVDVIQGNAAQVDIGTPPDVVVSETIGALGPEENIVGLTHALRQRYPDIGAPSSRHGCASWRNRSSPRRRTLFAQAPSERSRGSSRAVCRSQP